MAPPQGREILGRTIGVVGCGAIGRTVAELCLSLGMNALGYDPYLNDIPELGPRFRAVPLEEVLATADIVSLHRSPRDKPLIDATAIGAMRDGVVLVNTARAELIDDDALLAALESGKISAFATDVYHTEPPTLTALLRHENTILSPHAGGFTDESVDRATRIGIDNLLRRLEAS